jgi:hypothetical protein
VYKPSIIIVAVFAHKGAFVYSVVDLIALGCFDRGGTALEEQIGICRSIGNGLREGCMRQK